MILTTIFLKKIKNGENFKSKNLIYLKKRVNQGFFNIPKKCKNIDAFLKEIILPEWVYKENSRKRNVFGSFLCKIPDLKSIEKSKSKSDDLIYNKHTKTKRLLV